MLSISRQALQARLRRGSLLALPAAQSGDVLFPQWQVGHDGRILPGLPRLLRALRQKGKNDRACIRFLLRADDALGGARPVDVLRAGRQAEVLATLGASGRQPRRTVLTDTLVRSLAAAGGAVRSGRLRVAVQQAAKCVPDATWHSALNRLVDGGLIARLASRKSTEDEVLVLADPVVDLRRGPDAGDPGIVRLTLVGQLYALVLHLASLAKPTARQQAQQAVSRAWSVALVAEPAGSVPASET